MNLQTVSLKNYSSLHVGGDASMVLVRDEKELLEAFSYAEEKNMRVHILGEGTNTFFGDVLDDLLVIKMEMKGIVSKPSTSDHQLATISAGEIWDDLVRYAVDRNLWGIENLSYIPGTVGAAPVQNIGAYGVELQDVFVQVRAYDMQTKIFTDLNKEECHFTYRDSIFKRSPGRYAIVSITLELSTLPQPKLTYAPLDILQEKKDVSLQDIRDAVIAIRTAKLPDYKQYPNVGSFFKNPTIQKVHFETLQSKYPTITAHETPGGYKVSAAWLIDHCAGLKGQRVGNMGTWPTQPLVLVNYGNATHQEVMEFSDLIIQKVYETTAVKLEREVNNIV